LSAPTTAAPTAPTDASPAPPAPKLGVTLKIDGAEVTVPKGTNLLQACLQSGADISYFCYHPGLSAPAVCRQCLVEVAGQPKPVPSCYMQCADGMQVVTNSPKVLALRQQMLEFTLLNHPVDCPICDKAGECTLQKLYMEWDGKRSRLDHDKQHKPKVVDLGPTIVLDAERCILCTRCVRVCDEVAGVHQLEMMQRGDRATLSVAPGHALDNPYSLNTVDVCPVGALTSKDFRFAMRAWELAATSSICPGCATGCNVDIHGSKGQLYRVVPRHNADVNRYWMCDDGRTTYASVHHARVATSLQKGLPAAGAHQLGRLADGLRTLTAGGGEPPLGAVFSAQRTNEDNFAFAKLVFDVLGIRHVYLVGKAAQPGRADAILRDADVNPNTRGALAAMRGRAQNTPDSAGGANGDLRTLMADVEAGRLRGLLCLSDVLPVSESDLNKLAQLELLAVLATHDSPLTAVAHVTLPAADWAEVNGTFVNRQGRVQRLREALPPAGQSEPAWRLVGRIAKALGDAGFDWEYPRQLFEEARAQTDALAGAEWGKDARPVHLRFAGTRG
jgi:NADH-quinone oxidoreductase subunit G